MIEVPLIDRATPMTYDEWCERSEDIPMRLECYECARGFGVDPFGDAVPKREVKKLGPIAEARRDPTQTYVLTCGHTVI